MTDNIKPEHYRKGEIDLFESWYQTRPFNEFRAIMESVAERYMKRDKEDRILDLDKAIYTLERLKEKEIEHREKQEKVKSNKTLKEDFAGLGKAFGGSNFDEWFRNKEDSESVYLLKGFLQHGFNFIARDSDGSLFVYGVAPKKGHEVWAACLGDKGERISSYDFLEVQWEDNEPTEIANLLATNENGGENGK